MEIFIERSYAYNIVKVFAREKTKNGFDYISNTDNKIQFTSIDNYDASQEIKPIIEMPTKMFDLFLVALTKEANKQGINTENENLLKGKLEATEKHLEDMRLAFQGLLNSKD